MARPRHDADQELGNDSFLDVIANIVGILIILVMVTGVRVKTFSSDDTELPAEPMVDVQAAQLEVAALIAQQTNLASEAQRLQAQREQQALVVEEMAGRVAALKTTLVDRSTDLQRKAAEQQQQRAERLKEVQQQQGRLTGLLKELEEAANKPRKTVQLEPSPTPISQAVNGPEVHLQLLGGRLAYVPLEELAEQVKREIRAKIDLLRTSPELTGVVGPVRGFKLRYTIERLGVPTDPALIGMTGGAQVTRITFIPDSQTLGSPLEACLAPNSEFRRMLMQFDPARTAVTVWTYPDSFGEFRQLKKELYLLGFSVAGRPLPFGKLIEGSPQGTRSAAQ
jgi:hypothetical protein